MRFKVDGNTLPFVVIADSEGKQLACRSGYGSPEEFKKLIKEAKKKMPATPPAVSGIKASKLNQSGLSIGGKKDKTASGDN